MSPLRKYLVRADLQPVRDTHDYKSAPTRNMMAKSALRSGLILY